MPYMTGQYTMNTGRLRKYLGEDYEKVMQYTIADAFADCFSSHTPSPEHDSAAVAR